ncbi:ESX-2 secretion system protein EccE2 [Frankliniella fusca]|uniref:ESX-2 secretion system protein EccE2 n=1 Tax=Frankliniella fusca TaxID=407009 RepID=A0AAE1HQD1_9NEOP|nr:ESX-2 secretion system protein EccE2 [Frankliniella fusca]
MCRHPVKRGPADFGEEVPDSPPNIDDNRGGGSGGGVRAHRGEHRLAVRDDGDAARSTSVTHLQVFQFPVPHAAVKHLHLYD